MISPIKAHKSCMLDASWVANPPIHTFEDLVFCIFFSIYYQFNSIVFFHFIFPPKGVTSTILPLGYTIQPELKVTYSPLSAFNVISMFILCP